MKALLMSLAVMSTCFAKTRIECLNASLNKDKEIACHKECTQYIESHRYNDLCNTSSTVTEKKPIFQKIEMTEVRRLRLEESKKKILKEIKRLKEKPTKKLKIPILKELFKDAIKFECEKDCSTDQCDQKCSTNNTVKSLIKSFDKGIDQFVESNNNETPKDNEIQHITLGECAHKNFDNEGSLTVEGVKEFLKRLKVDKTSFDKAEVTDKGDTGGFFSKKIYFIESGGKKFVLKEPGLTSSAIWLMEGYDLNTDKEQHIKQKTGARVDDETLKAFEKALIFTAKSDIEEGFNATNAIKKMQERVVALKNNIDFSFTEAAGCYNDLKNQEHCLVLMRMADGKAIKDITDEKSLEDSIKAAAHAIGTLHGAFYNKCDKELPEPMCTNGAHQDLHNGNIFYDSQSKKITFIDIGGIAESQIKAVSVGVDLKPFTSEHAKKKNFQNSFNQAYEKAANEACVSSDKCHQKAPAINEKGKKWLEENTFKN